MTSGAHEIYQTSPETSTPWGRISLVIALMLIAAFALVTRPSIHGNDGVQNFAYLHSLMFDGDLDFSNEYDYYMSRQAEWFDKKQIPRDPVTDLPINLYGTGSSILWAPWVFTTHGLGTAANAMGARLSLDGYSPLYSAAVGYGSCFYATLALWLLYNLMRRLTNEIQAGWAFLLIWLASPLFFYMYIHPSMSHANAFFLATLVLVQYLIRPVSALKWGLLGLTSGLMVITRFQDGVLLAGLLAGELWEAIQKRGLDRPFLLQKARCYLAWVVAFCIALIPQLLVWKKLQGSYFSGPRAYVQQGDFSLLMPSHIPEVLFGSNHGLFYWHPALLIAFAGLLGAGILMKEKLIALAAFAGQTWIVAAWSIWWAGASFGHRMFVSVLPFLAIGALFTVGKRGRVGIALKAVLLLLIFWNFGCIVQYALGWIPRQKGVPYAVLAHNNFVRLPLAVLSRTGLQ